MENSVIKRGINGNTNFNNMTDAQLQDWHRALLNEAQRENYVNHHLEIVRYFRSKAIAGARVLRIERNAIDAAIARHGICVTNANGEGDSDSADEQEGLQPPLRRARLNQAAEQEHAQLDLEQTQDPAADSYGHYVALAHIFSNSCNARQEQPATADAVPASASGSSGSGTSNCNNNNNANNEAEDAANMAIAESIDSLGLRRT